MFYNNCRTADRHPYNTGTVLEGGAVILGYGGRSFKHNVGSRWPHVLYGTIGTRLTPAVGVLGKGRTSCHDPYSAKYILPINTPDTVPYYSGTKETTGIWSRYLYKPVIVRHPHRHLLPPQPHSIQPIMVPPLTEERFMDAFMLFSTFTGVRLNEPDFFIDGHQVNPWELHRTVSLRNGFDSVRLHGSYDVFSPRL